MLACRSAVVKGAAVFAGRSTGQGSRLQASARMVTKAAGRYLVCFDFDHTVVDENSDTWIYRALPSQTIPADLKASYQRGQWTAFMQRIFDHMAAQGVTKEGMEATLRAIPFTPGMEALLHFLAAHSPASFDCVVASDANDFFIRTILDAHPLPAPGASNTATPAEGGQAQGQPGPSVHASSTDACAETSATGLGEAGVNRTLAALFSRVYTNPATWEGEEGQQGAEPCPSSSSSPSHRSSSSRLRIRHHHAHSCPRCTLTPNMCKRAILVEHTGQAAREPSDATATTAGACTAAVPQQQGRQHYDRVLYVGDGSNDVCPALWLGPRDAVFARRGLALAKALQAMQQQAQHAQQQGHCAQSGGPPGQPGARHGDEYDLSQGGAAQEGQPCPPSAAPVAAGLGSTGAQSDGAAAAGAADAAGGPGEALRAQLVVWDSGEEILQWIKQNLELAPAAV